MWRVVVIYYLLLITTSNQIFLFWPTDQMEILSRFSLTRNIRYITGHSKNICKFALEVSIHVQGASQLDTLCNYMY